MDFPANTPFSKGSIGACFNPRHQHLILFPTEKCNFRCTYCYETFEHGSMPQGVRQGIKNLISQRVPELGSLALSWFGGEPLIARHVVLEIAEHACLECKRHGVHLFGDTTTNAYLLTEELFRRLLELEQRSFQITLDGWEDAHDRERVQADGGKTFSRIWSNLLMAKGVDEEFAITLRCHINAENFRSVRRLAREIAREFGKDHRFRVHFHDVRNLGGEGGSRVLTVEKEEYEQQVAELHDILERENMGNLSLSVSAAPAGGVESDTLPVSPTRSGDESSAHICYAAKPNSLAIRADGSIAKCTVALGSTENEIGHIEPDGRLVLDIHRLRPWMRGFETLSAEILGCPLGAVMKGGQD